PQSAACRATHAARALATIVFVGMQPLLTQVPPKRLRSTTATFLPAPASRAARKGPACPVPITMSSNLTPMFCPRVDHGLDRASTASLPMPWLDRGRTLLSRELGGESLVSQ